MLKLSFDEKYVAKVLMKMKIEKSNQLEGQFFSLIYSIDLYPI